MKSRVATGFPNQTRALMKCNALRIKIEVINVDYF